ncbi:MAG: hypothetical protein ACW99Q_15940 [Candidatus Kariarchaeaceae archaeon]|jgi:hypothetical protein
MSTESEGSTESGGLENIIIAFGVFLLFITLIRSWGAMDAGNSDFPATEYSVNNIEATLGFAIVGGSLFIGGILLKKYNSEL